MRRKIIQIAGSTHLVSIPKAWIVENKIKKGDEVEVITNRDSVTIKPDKEDTPEVITVDVSDINLFVFRFLAAVYKSGYDEIELKIGKNDSIGTLPRQMNAMLPGYELVDQKKDSIFIKNISKGLDSEFNTILRKIFLITRSMANNTLEHISAKEYAKLADTLILEESTNRFCNFCERMLNKKGYKNSKKTCFIYNIVWELEKVTDQYKYMNIYLMNKKTVAINPQTIRLMKKTAALIDTFYGLFYKFDANKVQIIAASRKELIKECNELFSDKKNDPKVVHHLSNIIQMIFNMLGSYLGSAF